MQWLYIRRCREKVLLHFNSIQKECCSKSYHSVSQTKGWKTIASIQSPSDWRTEELTGWSMIINEDGVRFVPRQRLNPVLIANAHCAKYFFVVMKRKTALSSFTNVTSAVGYIRCISRKGLVPEMLLINVFNVSYLETTRLY